MSTLSMTELEQRYDGESHDWTHKVERLGFGRAYRHLLEQILSGYTLPPHARVLDAGVGTGLFTASLAKTTAATRADRSGRIAFHGVDISAEMLKEARTELNSSGINLHTTQGSVERLPYADETFDLVISAHVLEHLDRPEDALSEFERVLKPNGTLVIVSTQNGIWGRKITREWGVELISAESLLYMSLVAGLTQFKRVPFGGAGLPHFASYAATARKPACNSTSVHRISRCPVRERATGGEGCARRMPLALPTDGGVTRPLHEARRIPSAGITPRSPRSAATRKLCW